MLDSAILESSNGKTADFQSENGVSTTPSSTKFSSKNDWRRDYDRKRYHDRMQKAIEILGGKCVWCGETSGLEFDHVDPKQKDFTISDLWTKPIEVFMLEVNKCRLLCSTCHTIRHNITTHGTHSYYVNRKCRCDLCRKANSESSKEWKRRNKERKRNGKSI